MMESVDLVNRITCEINRLVWHARGWARWHEEYDQATEQKKTTVEVMRTDLQQGQEGVQSRGDHGPITIRNQGFNSPSYKDWNNRDVNDIQITRLISTMDDE